MILYDICILLRHIYNKNNLRTAQVGHLHNPYCIGIIKLTRGYSSSRCRSSIKLTKIFRIMQLFQWYYTIKSRYTYQEQYFETVSFSTVLTRSFSLQLLNNHVIIDYQMMIILKYLPLQIPVISLVRICHLQNNSHAPTREFFAPSAPGM